MRRTRDVLAWLEAGDHTPILTCGKEMEEVPPRKDCSPRAGAESLLLQVEHKRGWGGLGGGGRKGRGKATRALGRGGRSPRSPADPRKPPEPIPFTSSSPIKFPKQPRPPAPTPALTPSTAVASAVWTPGPSVSPLPSPSASAACPWEPVMQASGIPTRGRESSGRALVFP